MQFDSLTWLAIREILLPIFIPVFTTYGMLVLFVVMPKGTRLRAIIHLLSNPYETAYRYTRLVTRLHFRKPRSESHTHSPHLHIHVQ